MFTRLLRMLFALSILIAVIPFGSVHAGWMLFSCIVSGVTFLLAVLLSRRIPAWRWMVRATALIVIVLGGWVVLQSIRVSDNPFAHPAWEAAASLLGPIAGAISVNPATTLGSLPQLLTPFLVFLSVPFLYTRDQRLEQLWVFLSLFGGAIALFGIVQFALSPDSLLWEAKRHYFDSLTATFVNRNNAGTFLAISAIINLGLCVRIAGELRRSGELRSFMTGHLTKSAVFLLGATGSFLASLSAVFLTQSRGATLAALAGLVVTGILIALPHLVRRRWSLRSSAVAIATGVVSLLLFATFAGRAARRLDLAGIDASRLCTFEAMGNAIADSPVSGTGFGTFAEIFPAYRLAECAGINGVWYQAHNSYLEGYFGLGAVFGVVVAFGLVSLLWIFAIGLRQRRGFRFAPAAATGVLVAISLHALVDFSIQIHGIAVYAAAVLGTGAAISLNRRRPQQSGPAYPGARERDAEIESRSAPEGSDMTENTDRDRRDARQRGAGASPETA